MINEGRKSDKLLIIFDEAEGIDKGMWEAAHNMFMEENNSSWLIIQSPINVSQPYIEENKASVE